MKNKTVEGLLDELGADIYCFQGTCTYSFPANIQNTRRVGRK